MSNNVKASLYWNTILPLGVQGIKFIVSIIIARLLEPRDFGIMGVASIIIFYTDSLTTFGLTTALIQKDEITTEHIDSVFTFNIGVSLSLAAIMTIISNNLADYFNVPELKNVIIALSLMFVITSFYQIPVTLLRRELNFREVSLVAVYRAVLQSAVALFFAFYGFGYWALVISLILSQLFGSFYVLLRVAWKPRLQYTHSAAREIIKFASWNFGLAQIRVLSDYVDKLIIGKFLGPVMLGFYDKGFSIAAMPVKSISNKISSVMFSSFSQLKKNNDNLKIQFNKAIVAVSVICFPIFVGLFSISPYFVKVLLGEKWLPMIFPFQILLISCNLSALMSIITALNIAAGNYVEHIKRRFFILVLVAVGCLYFVQWGISAIAVVVLVSNFLLLIFSFDLCRRYLFVEWTSFALAVFPALSGVIVMFVLVKSLSIYFLSETNLVNMMLLIAIGFVSYTAWILKVKFKQTEFIRNEVREKIQRLIGV